MMLRSRISAVAITLVICFLGTSPIIGDCRRLLSSEETTDTSGSGSSSNGMSREYYNSSLLAVASSSMENQIPPIDLLMEMSRATDIEEFLRFVDTSSIDPKDNLLAPRAVVGMERSSVVIPKMATCTPSQTVVPLLPEGASASASVNYFPSCTRVNRCGGCCTSALLSCQPTASETLTFQVIKSEYTGGRFSYRNKELVLVEQHTKCACLCAVREEHCNDQQKYIPANCQCVCQNTEERDKCLKQSETKLWDPVACRCGCRKYLDCTTGSFFNENQCECLKIPIYSNGNSVTTSSSVKNNPNPVSVEDRKKFIIKAIPLPSADTTKYSTTN